MPNHNISRLTAKTILCLLCAASIPQQAMAVSPPSGGGGAGYGWSCYPTAGLFANVHELQDTQDNLIDAIKTFGKTLNKGQMQQMKTTLNTLDQTLQAWALSQKQLRAAREATRVLLSADPASQPQNKCQTAAAAGQVNQGLAQSRANAAAMAKAVADFNDTAISTKDAMNRIATAPAQTLSAHALFAATGSTAESMPNVNDQVKYIANLTNPVPSAKLTMMQGITPAGKTWKAYEHASMAPLTLSQNALAYIASRQQATIPADSFVSQWQQMGGTGAPPGVDANNRISPDAALSMAVAARYANGAWYSHLAEETKLGVLREINLMAATQTRIEMDQLKTSSYLAAMTAAQYAQQYVNPLVQQSNALVGQAKSQATTSGKQ